MHLGTIIAAVVLPLAAIALLVVLVRAQGRPVRGHPLNNPSPGVEVGSAAQIRDAGSVGWPSLLDAMTVRAGADDSEPDATRENSIAARLGLQAPKPASRFQPSLFYGTRHDRQVFIRIGIDETYLPGILTRHLRQISVVRAEVPEFELAGKRGVLRADSAVPEALRDVLRVLRPAPDLWEDLLVVGGPEGIVATRPVPQRVQVRLQWLYDLWLIERIADRLHAPALPTARLGESYLIPYGLGRG